MGRWGRRRATSTNPARSYIDLVHKDAKGHHALPEALLEVGVRRRVDLVGLTVERPPTSLISAVGLAASEAAIQAMLAGQGGAPRPLARRSAPFNVPAYSFGLFWCRMGHSRNVVS